MSQTAAVPVVFGGTVDLQPSASQSNNQHEQSLVELQPPPVDGSEYTVGQESWESGFLEGILGPTTSYKTDGAVASALRKKKPAQNEESDIEKGPSGEELLEAREIFKRRIWNEILEAQGATPNFEPHQNEETILRGVFYPECARVQDVAPSDVSHQTGGEREVNLEWVPKVCK